MDTINLPTQTSNTKSALKELSLWAVSILSLSLLALGVYYLFLLRSTSQPGLLSPISKLTNSRPLDAFTFEALANRTYQASAITLEKTLANGTTYDSHLFSFISDGRKVTGQLNLPLTPSSKKMPAVIMLRGYVDQSIYQTGVGTQNAAAVFASKGYITVAPDFLGYGGSDNPENDVFWERLSKPVIVLNLIESVKALDYVDPQNIFIWAHSNGGQIALSILEITGAPYPTTLWAPVSKAFPYNILYYTDEFDDRGKALRKELAQFEKLYDADLYSIDKYFNRLNAPLLIHQGTADDSVPLEWSNELADQLTTIQESTASGELLDVTYYTYPGADHNLQPSWNTVVQRDLAFFQKHSSK